MKRFCWLIGRRSNLSVQSQIILYKPLECYGRIYASGESYRCGLRTHICVFCKCPAWTKDTYMRLSIFPDTYAEVILLRLCEININAFLSNSNKQMPIMHRYNSCLPVSRTVASNYQEENVLFVWKIRECRKCDVGLCIDNCFEISHTQLNYFNLCYIY